MTDEERRAFEEQDKADNLSRRDFLNILAGSFAALMASGCKLRPPKEKIVPYLEQPENTVPGLTRWYASTCTACPAACGALVKSRDGRPIKMEGNPEHPLSRGGLCARGQASILDLYDGERLMNPLLGGSKASWASLDAEVASALSSASRRGKAIRVLSHTTHSPSLNEALSGFISRHPGAKRVVYDSLDASAIREAHRRTHGRDVLPRYRFELAAAIVSFDADFLGTWISPVEFTKSWAANRRPESESGGGFQSMSWHAQFEAGMSVTGASADLRVPLPPSERLCALLALGRLVAKRLSWSGPLPKAESCGLDQGVLESTADLLVASKGRSLVVSGSSDVDVQVAVNWLNEMLGNYGRTVDLARPSYAKAGSPGALLSLIEELEEGRVGALIVFDANPAYDNPLAARFRAAAKKADFMAVLSQRRDETASLARAVAASSHSLESWGDAQPAEGVVSLIQPLVSPFFDTRSVLESFLVWSGRNESAYDFVKEHWRARVFPRQDDVKSWRSFWDEAVRVGAVTTKSAPEKPPAYASSAAAGLKVSHKKAAGFELAAYSSVSLADGSQANNPWLQELPDPVTKVAWGNCALFSPADAKRLGLENGRMVRLSSAELAVDLPACVQPGHADGVVSAALGYGRPSAGPIAANYPVVKLLPIEKDPPGGADLFPLSSRAAVDVRVLSDSVVLAKTQQYDSQTVPFTGQTRPILIETTVQDYFTKPLAEEPEGISGDSLWPRHAYEGHKWGMAINLTSCTGCSGCVVACQAENNVPVVGKAEVRKGREMHWIRIDRYFDENADNAAFQPMLCQHCDNAPCETVCPVLASVHSTEGLNMQVYNRCVGTRYCANNCPYKVRRFNWFDYAHEDLLQNMSLNPDVTVRTRGVMEKCSFCVQRIYTAKFQAKSEGRALKDGDISPACAQSCPADAIVFGDLNDPDSRVSRLRRENRSYRVLAEIGVGPSIFYGVKVRNIQARKA